MPELQDARELAIEPERWRIKLKSGAFVEVLTHGYSIESGRYLFKLLFRGEPNFEVVVLNMPADLVDASPANGLGFPINPRV